MVLVSSSSACFVCRACWIGQKSEQNPRINKQKNIWAPVNNNLPFVFFFRYHPLLTLGWRKVKKQKIIRRVIWWLPALCCPFWSCASIKNFLYLSLLASNNTTTNTTAEAKLIGPLWVWIAVNLTKMWNIGECSIVMIFSLPSNSILNVEQKLHSIHHIISEMHFY